MKLLPLLLAIVFSCHFQQINGQDGSGNGGVVLPELTVGFEQSAYTFYESMQETTPQICVSVSTESPNIEVVLEITINPDTAQDGVDFVFNNTQLVVDETSDRQCVTFTIINDAVSEGGEILQAYLSLLYAVDNGTIRNDSSTIVMLTVDQANITIFDNVGFSEVPLSQTELLNSGPISFSCVSTPNFQAFNILWSINGQPVDLEQTPSGVQTMSRIDENTGALTSMLVVPTTLAYDSARVVCNLVSEGGTSVSDPAVLKLLFATVAFAEDMYTIGEAAGTLRPSITILSSSLPEGTNITLNVSTAPDSATGGADYVPTMLIISLTGIDVSPGSQHLFTVNVIDDNDLESDETFFLLLNPLSPGVLVNSSMAMAVVIIVDDDVHVGVGFDPVVYNVSEGEMAMLRVILNTTIDQTITVFLQTQDGSAIASMDYETVTRTLTFRNSTEQIVPVPIIADDRTENMESFTALLTEPTPSGSAFVTTSTANINIIDQQVAVVRFTSSEYTVNEDDRHVQIGVQLLTITERPIVVTLTLEPGSAQSPGDYMSQDAIPVTLDLESPQVVVLVTIVDDNVYDGTKDFYATISSQSERVSISENRTRVIIRDNEVVYAWFNPIGYNVSEDAGVATLMIERIGANGIPVNISVTTQNVNATAGVDYEPVSEEVIFPPSLEQVTSLVVNISLIDNTNITGEVKQFQASLNTSQDGVLFFSDNRTATINIFDDDRIQIDIGFLRSEYAVSESDGSVAPIIVVEGNVSTAFDVVVTAMNETALSRRDYELLQSVFTINPGTSLYVIDVAIFENSIVEVTGFRSFSLVLTTTEGSVVFTNRTTLITIYDNDFSAPAVTISNDVSATIVTDIQPINFTCNVTTPVNSVDVIWLDGNGDVVSNSTQTAMGYDISETIAGDSIISVLMLSSFSLSEYIQGPFSCVGRVGNPFQERVASADTPPITSRLAAPFVNINLLPFSSRNITVGQNITVQCAISTDYGRPTDIEVTPHIVWEVSYESNGERVMNSFEATELTVLTPAVFLASLEYAPVVSTRNFTCLGYVEPMVPSLSILRSETTNDSRIVSPQVPALSVTIDPQPVIIIADVPPYNNYTLTCNATIPRDLIHLQVSFTIYRSSVVASANFTPVDDCISVMFTGDRLCSYAVAFTEMANLPDAPERVCSVELVYIDSETSEMISVARENASTLLLVNAPVPPAPIFDYHVYGVSTELAILHWVVPRIVYTPETYHIQYRPSSDGESDVVFTSITVVGSSDLSARDIEYSITLDGLTSGTFYIANIVANNTFGGLVSPDISFATNTLDIYRIVSDIDDTIPLGAPISIDFGFNGEGITLPPSSSTDLTFYPLFHVPAIEPTRIFYDVELRRIIVSYNHVSPSLSGEYVLCQEAGPPPSRRRRGVDPEPTRPNVCGGRITITVTIPTLSVSTNLLIEQYVDNTYVGGDQSPSVTCLPSDTRAPVRWRLSTGVYGDISDDYLVTLSPRSLNHTAIFPVAYEILPRRSAFYICDLINIELPSGVEVSPRSITVRFIQTEIAILNSDMELPLGSVINQFNFGSDGPEPFLSLNCLSVRGHPYLEWVSRDVPSLLPDGSISSLSSPNIRIEYFAESDSQQRDTVLTVNPLTQGLTGYYSCRSRQSGVSAGFVYTTFVNPLWLLTTPILNYIPIGSVLPVVSVLYADFSFGYENFGLGFSYSLTFEPYSSGPDMMLSPNQTNSSDSQQQLTSNRVTVISGRTNTLTGNNLTYLITGELGKFDGRYRLNATHLSSGVEYSTIVEVNVIVPYFIEAESLVYSRIGDAVTLTCLPNDTMTTVYWLRLTGRDEVVPISLNSDFTLSPPQRNHQLIFNATNIILRALGDDLPLQDRVYNVACAFANGGNISDLISQMNVTVQLQAERIRMLTFSSEVLQIRNNTVINRFTAPEGMLGSAFGEGAPDLDLGSIGGLSVNCNAAQGDHQPVWTSDNLEITDMAGDVVDFDLELNGQIVVSNYTARLQFGRINRQIEGNYFCRSQISNLFTTFFLSIENPYIRAVSSPQLTVIEGEPVTLVFLVATDSDGATWNNRAVTFSFTNRSGVQYSINSNFQNSNPDFPQYFVYTIPKVLLSHAGIYSAFAPRRDCSALGESTPCGIASANIDLTVKTYCPEQIDSGILWPRTESNSEVSRACNLAGSLFRQRTFIKRYCSEIGTWSDIDFSTCTLVADPPPFLLLSFVLETGEEVNGLDDDSTYLETQMKNLLRDRGILFTDVILQSSYIASISVTFEVTLPFTPTQDEQLVSFSNYFTTSFTMFGNFSVRPGNRTLRQVSASDACPCLSSSGPPAKAGLNFVELCSGVSISPCNCTSGLCQCSPPFVGDGVRCTLDSDGDGYPDVALLDSSECSDPEGTQQLFCIQDNCPMVINPDQDQFACQSDTDPVVFNGCPFEIDSVWGITWPNTERNSSNVQLCPGGYDALGTASRYCNSAGQWEEANVLACTTVEFIGLEEFAQATIAILDPEEQILQSAELTQQLIQATEPQNRSLLPNDLQASTRVLTTVLQVLESNDNATADLSVIDIFDNMLDVSQMDGWRTLQMAGLMNSSEVLLNNAERYGLLVASSVNGSVGDDQSALRQSRSNIVVTGNQYREAPTSSVSFPTAADLINYTKSSMDSTQINIPPSLIQERMIEMDDSSPLPVFFLLIRDLPMGVFLTNATAVPATTCMEEGTLTTAAATDVVAAQVGMGNNQLSPSQILQDDPVTLSFSFDTVANGSLYRCVYWNFSQPAGNGRWVIAGVTTTDVTTSGNQTAIRCSSTHLTSFAVLVDVAGGLADIPDPERTALQIISYIGCAISILCLLGTVLFFLFQGKKLKTSAHYFVHLNLALSLLLAFTVYVVGVETAIGSTGGCAFVAALLHYLFLSAFCWMLCEGIMLYLLLIVVFSKMSKKWWPFLLIGYLPPLPVVVITVGVRYQYYGVRDNCGELLYCWLSVEQGTIFGFVAPMLAIIFINVVFLIMALVALFKTKKRQLRRKREYNETSRKTAKAIFTASIVLLPLLGLTWAFGILTVNVNTTAFAWLFTIFNSLQGAFIFFFHVVRSDQVWSKVSPKIQTLKRSTFSSAKWYEVSSAGTSTLSKGSTMKSTLKGHFGSLSRDPNSTLGRGDTYKKTNVSQLSSQSPSSYELKTDLSPVSEHEAEEVGTGIETETKVDLSMPEKSASNETNASPDSALVESSPKDKQKLISEEGEPKVNEGDVAIITNPATEVADKETINPERYEQDTPVQIQLKADTESSIVVEAPTHAP